jgi:hypothetical protein
MVGDQTHPDCGGQVKNSVASLDQVIDHELVKDGTLDEREVGVLQRLTQVGDLAGGQGVENHYFVAAREQGVDHVRADEAASACYQI